MADKRWRVTVDKEKCIGCVACTSVSDNFAMGPDDKAFPKKEEVEELGTNKDAQEICPTQAIVIEEIKGEDKNEGEEG